MTRRPLADPAAIRCAIVSGDLDLRGRLEDALAAHPRLSLAATYGDGASALALRRTRAIAAVLLDLEIPDGLRLLRALSRGRRWRRPRVVALGSHLDDEVAVEVLGAGAAGLLDRETPVSEVLRAVESIDRGDLVVPGAIPGTVAADLISDLLPVGTDLSELSPRELAVLELVAIGLDNDGIATRLSITVGTVRSHLEHLRTKLGVVRRAELVVVARRAGLGHRPPSPSESGHEDGRPAVE